MNGSEPRDPDRPTNAELYRLMLRIETGITKRIDGHEKAHLRADERRATYLRWGLGIVVTIALAAVPIVVGAVAP